MNYLIISCFHRLTNDLIKSLSNPDFETIKFDLNSDSINQVLEEANYNSLFGRGKNIIIYNCNLFSPKGGDSSSEEELNKYLNNPSNDTILIFVSSEKEDNRKKVTKILKGNNSIYNYYKIDYRQLKELVGNYLKDNKINLSSDVISYIIRNCSNNYDLICNEIDKLLLCYQNNNISLDMAKDIISTGISDSVYKFNDAVILKNYKESMSLLNDLKITKIDPALILVMLSKEYKLMFFSKIIDHNSLNKIYREENLADWQINKVLSNAGNYSKKELMRIIDLLAEYDYKYKSGQIDRQIVIDLFLLDYFN